MLSEKTDHLRLETEVSKILKIADGDSSDPTISNREQGSSTPQRNTAEKRL